MDFTEEVFNMPAEAFCAVILFAYMLDSGDTPVYMAGKTRSRAKKRKVQAENEDLELRDRLLTGVRLLTQDEGTSDSPSAGRSKRQKESSVMKRLLSEEERQREAAARQREAAERQREAAEQLLQFQNEEAERRAERHRAEMKQRERRAEIDLLFIQLMKDMLSER